MLQLVQTLVNVAKKRLSVVVSPFLRVRQRKGDRPGYVYRHWRERGTDPSLIRPEAASLAASAPPSPKGYQFLPRGPLEEHVIQCEGQVLPPMLEHGLREVIRQPGVHPLRDTWRTNKFRFTPYLQKIVQPKDIDFRGVPPFVTTSQDETLHRLALEHKCRFKGSTSSVTPLLSQLHFYFSLWKDVDISAFSERYTREPRTFTRASLRPCVVMLRPADGVISVDGDSGEGTPNNQILLDLGKTLERMLTMTPSEFHSTLVQSEDYEPPTEFEPEAYHYMRIGEFLYRSQLDCYDPDIDSPRKTFDLKTRATLAVRLDCGNYLQHLDYRLTKLQGFRSSYEREFYDMVRSAFLKYSFQARIGHMHGVFVAYHNTDEIFGFEYVPLAEMDRCVSGSSAFADASYAVSNQLMHKILRAVTDRFPDKPVRMTVWGNKGSRELEIYAEAVENDQGWQEKSIPGQYPASADTSAEVPATESATSRLLHARPEELAASKMDVARFTLTLATYVNSQRMYAPFEINEGDTVDVAYRLVEEKDRSRIRLLREYQDSLRRAYLFDFKALGKRGGGGGSRGGQGRR